MEKQVIIFLAIKRELINNSNLKGDLQKQVKTLN